MVRRVSYGNVFRTDAVVKSAEQMTAAPDYLQVSVGNTITLQYNMDKTDIVYGLGENVRGINKRGFTYISNCSDDSSHTEEKHSLYGAHNFIMVSSQKKMFGLFLDSPSTITYDIGDSDTDLLKIEAADSNLDLYIIEENSLIEIVKSFRELVGQSYMAPKWAFGYQQSRWSYMTSDEVREVARKYDELKFPLEAIYLDIDYMEAYKDFTINRETFPDFEQLIQDMKQDEIHLVPIIDGGVKIEDGYKIYEEGKQNGYFCKREDGTDFVAGVWPGKCHFPDFLNQEARAWFGEKYNVLLEKGIDGFWNDMNEPAIFYSEEGLKDAFSYIDSVKGENLDINTVFKLRDAVNNIANNPDDYKRFYHNVDGEKIRHDKVHNLFGYNMTRAAKEAFEKLVPGKRILMFSRSSAIGAHRYGGIWTGDNASWWSHLLLNIKMMPSLNMCGFLYTGADIGGFGSNITEDLMIRWLQFGMFTPLFRNHAAIGTRHQELYEFKQKDIIRNMLELRYALVPYLYSEYMKAVYKNEMMFLPLSFVYTEDEYVNQVEDQLLVGESIMIAPVYQQNATGRYVYLPEDMLCLKMKGVSEYESKVYEKGHHYVEAGLGEVLVFVRSGHILPLGGKADRVSRIDYNSLKLIGYKAEGKGYELYNDDGITEGNWDEKNIRIMK